MIKKYFADYILISSLSSPSFIENGELIADAASGRVLSVRKNGSGRLSAKKGPSRDSGEGTPDFRTIIIPGFINSHTHTDLAVMPDKATPRVFSQWVVSLLEKRKSLSLETANNLRLKAFNEFIKCGTTLIGDIIQSESFYSVKALLSKSELIPKVKGFVEIRGLDPAAAGQRMSDFKAFYKKYGDVFKENKNYFSLGISPHSVYSVSESLFKEILKENIEPKMGLKIAIHAAEHFAETQFISGTGGDIALNLLPKLNLSKFSKPLKLFKSPIDYLNRINILNKNSSLIHANEISGDDIEIIKNSGTAIIHCPRSNAFFNSKKLPLKKLLDNGVPVSLGTDSLYSNESLSILDELAYAKKIHPDVSSKDLFSMATVKGAAALSFGGVTGTLEPDSYCDFSIFKIEKNIKLDEDNVYDIATSFKETDIISVAINGNIIYNNIY